MNAIRGTLNLTLSSLTKENTVHSIPNNPKSTLLRDIKLNYGNNIVEEDLDLNGLLTMIPAQGFYLTDVNNNDLSLKLRGKTLIINVKIRDENGRELLSIDNNNWFRNPNLISKFNYDNKGLEIVDESGDIVFSIDITNDILIIQEVLKNRQQNKICISGIYGTQIIKLTDDYRPVIKRYIVPIFDYTGDSWLGQRVKRKSLLKSGLSKSIQ